MKYDDIWVVVKIMVPFWVGDHNFDNNPYSYNSLECCIAEYYWNKQYKNTAKGIRQKQSVEAHLPGV